MLKRLIAPALLALFLASPALASQCPADMAKIDAALASNASLSAEDKAKVQALRDEGEALHKSGKHGESVETLAKAKEMLGID